MDVTKIQIGNILMNKTKRFLTPCLKSYGQEFENRFNATWKIAVGVGDIITVKSGVIFEKHLFILCDTESNTQTFIGFRDWLKTQEHIYADDYVFDHVTNGYRHMIVIKIPQEFHHAYETFKEGYYSQMYTFDEVKKFFNQTSDIAKILVKDHKYKVIFTQKLREEFNVNISPEEIDETFEFELPPYWNDELFNENVKLV